MEIEVLTTKKKLTKSIINQMPWQSGSLDGWKCLGYILNQVRFHPKVLILSDDNGNYQLLDSRWKVDYSPNKESASNRSVHYLGKYSYMKSFNTQEERNKWYDIFSDLRDNAQQIYI